MPGYPVFVSFPPVSVAGLVLAAAKFA